MTMSAAQPAPSTLAATSDQPSTSRVRVGTRWISDSPSASVMDGSGGATGAAHNANRSHSQEVGQLRATQYQAQPATQERGNKGWGKKWDDKKTDDSIRMLTKSSLSNTQDMRSTKAIGITTNMTGFDQRAQYAAAAIPKAQRRDNPIGIPSHHYWSALVRYYSPAPRPRRQRGQPPTLDGAPRGHGWPQQHEGHHGGLWADVVG